MYVFLLDQQGKITFGYGEGLRDFDPKSVVGMSAWETVAEENVEAVKAAVSRTIVCREPQSIEIEHSFEADSIVTCHVEYVPVDESPVACVVLFRVGKIVATG